jgi:hypothetical protein
MRHALARTPTNRFEHPNQAWLCDVRHRAAPRSIICGRPLTRGRVVIAGDAGRGTRRRSLSIAAGSRVILRGPVLSKLTRACWLRTVNLRERPVTTYHVIAQKRPTFLASLSLNPAGNRDQTASYLRSMRRYGHDNLRR